MRLPSAIAGTVVFFFVAPAIVAGAVPLAISGGHFAAPFSGYWLMKLAGAVLIAGGLASLLASFARFAMEGRGTPAPIAPTAKLVVGGQYRYVRNPMYVAVLSIILGQALLFANLAVAAYGLLVFAAVHTFVVAYEESTLREMHGAAYDAYTAAVPRWIPRLTPWRS